MKNNKRIYINTIMVTMLSLSTMLSPITSVRAEEPQATEITNIKQEALPIEVPKDIIGEEGQKLQELTLPEQWSWVDQETALTKATTEYLARLQVDDIIYDYSTTQGYNEEGHYVEVMIPVIVNEIKIEAPTPIQETKTEVITSSDGIPTQEATLNVIQPLSETEPQKDTSLQNTDKAINTINDEIVVEINETTFPDPVFRDYVLTKFDKNNPIDYKLSKSEIDGVFSINVTGKDISTLKGIEYFTALKTLFCDKTKITELDLKKNTALENLDCSKTLLQSLDVSNNKALKTLKCYENLNLLSLNIDGVNLLEDIDCSQTGITTLDVTEKTKLVKLDCRKTGISKLVLNNNLNLTYLNCYSTKVEELDISHNLLLESLYVGSTNIKTLDVSKNKALIRLDCMDLKITELDVSNNPLLEYLYCNKTNIERLDLSNQKNLIRLDCYDTKLKSLDVSKNLNLTSLYCHNTPLTQLIIGDHPKLSKINLTNPNIAYEVTTKEFQIQDLIENVDLSKVKIRENGSMTDTGLVTFTDLSKPIVYTYESGTLTNGNKVLLTVKVGNVVEINDTNFPDEAFRAWLMKQDYGEDGKITQNELAGIKTIDVRINKNIKDLTGIKYFTFLEILWCSQTGITSLDVSSNTNLLRLGCDSNPQLKSLNVNGATALKYLYCHKTGLEELDVSQNTELYEIHCYSTQIESLDVSSNAKLYNLLCYDNPKLSKLNVTGATNLDLLRCEKTVIESLDISGNKKLRTLDCPFNAKLKSLNVTGATALQILACYDSGIIGLDVSKNTNLTTLYSSSNPYAYLNIGTNSNLNTINKDNLKPVHLEVKGKTFKMTDMFPGIDLKKIDPLTVTGANYNESTGEMSNYKIGTPITYTYNCGTSKNGPETIGVTLNLIGESTISITEDLNKAYDGNEVIVSVNKTGSNGTVTYTWEQRKKDQSWEVIASAPKDAGTYRVTAILAADDKHKEATSLPVEFIISQADNSWIKPLSIHDWIYGEAANTPTGKATYGTAVFTYSDSETGAFTSDVPTNAGTHYVKASVKDTNNYTGLEEIVSFKILPRSAKHVSVSEIKNEEDIKNFIVNDSETILELGTDYEIEQKQNKQEVIVTITFKGNYTGVITKSYTVKEEPDQPSIDEPTNNQHDIITGSTLIENGKDGLWEFAGNYHELAGISLDGKAFRIEPINKTSANLYMNGYTDIAGKIEEGSVKITLYEEFLKTLTKGSHTLKVNFLSNDMLSYGETSFEVDFKNEPLVEPEQPKEDPQDKPKQEIIKPKETTSKEEKEIEKEKPVKDTASSQTQSASFVLFSFMSIACMMCLMNKDRKKL